MRSQPKGVLDFGGQFASMTRPKNLTICGLFIALYVVLSYFNIRISSFLEIRFAFLVLAAAGSFGGPMMGLTIGVISDIISAFLSGQMFFAGFTISYGLLGFCFGLILYRRRPSIPRAIAASAVELFLSLTLNTFCLYLMYGTPLNVLITTRIVKCGVMFVVDALLLYMVLNVFAQVMQALNLAIQN